MSKKLSSIRGMNDILPDTTPLWQWLEGQVRHVLQTYGYSEIRMPIVEHTDLFKRSIGEVTDIVEKEMYTFEDRNGDSLTLRPEGTASCVRACEQAGMLYHQIGVEAFGMAGPDIDAEIILMTARLWRALGLTEQVTLELNSLGDSSDREQYRLALVDYLAAHKDQLDEDSLRRLERNPLRILDSKDPGTREVLAGAPQLNEFLGEEARSHFTSLCALLDAAGVAYRLNPALVRGLDYYGKTVFEWVTDALGAQGTVCAGGRYDGLVSQLGGKPAPAVGFAMGMERLILLLQQNTPQVPSQADVYIVTPTEAAAGLALAEMLRNELPAVRVVSHCGGGSLKSQMKKADRSGARFALILGEDELAGDKVTVKPLRGQGEQQQFDRQTLPASLAGLLESQD